MVARRASLEGRGIENLIPHPKSKPAIKGNARLVHKTFLLTPGLSERLDRAIVEAGVGKNEFVRYALNTFLKELEGGERKLPIQIKEVRTLVSG